MINHSTAYNLELQPGHIEEWHYDASEGYTTVSFKPHGDYSELRTISVTRQLLDINAVYSVIDVASQKAPILTQMNFGNNRVKGEFDLGKLIPIKKLKMFSIYENAIDKFVSSATEDMPSLQYMDIGGNKMSFEDFEIFERFPNLIQVSLSDNKLVGTLDLGKFQTMKKLFRISLDNNMITKISNTATENMPSIGEIVLTNNLLTSVDLNDFAKFVNLKELHLDGNKLTSIDGYQNARAIFQKIEKIPINRNEFKCDYFKEITEPYIWPSFWGEINDMERSCPGPKSVYHERRTCCYP